MTNTQLARMNMVNNQIYTNHVLAPELLQTLSELPREYFVPKAYEGIAYMDNDIPVGKGRFLMDPMTFARLVQVSGVSKESTVLDVGCSTGYSTAVFAALAKKVIAIEEDEKLASDANYTLNQLGANNVIIISERLSQGHPEGGPYNVIFINGMVNKIPPLLFSQLADGGKLIAVVRQANGLGDAVVYTREGDVMAEQHVFETNARPAQQFHF